MVARSAPCSQRAQTARPPAPAPPPPSPSCSGWGCEGRKPPPAFFTPASARFDQGKARWVYAGTYARFLGGSRRIRHRDDYSDHGAVAAPECRRATVANATLATAMTSTDFDSISDTKRLRDAGFNADQAQTIAEGLHQAVIADRSTIASKADLAALKADVAALRIEMRILRHPRRRHRRQAVRHLQRRGRRAFLKRRQTGTPRSRSGTVAAPAAASPARTHPATSPNTSS